MKTSASTEVRCLADVFTFLRLALALDAHAFVVKLYDE